MKESDERTIGEAMDSAIQLLGSVTKINPSWRKKVSRKLAEFAEGLKYAEGESEGEGDSDSEAYKKHVRTETQAQTEQRVRAAVNEELVPSLRRRWGIAPK